MKKHVLIFLAILTSFLLISITEAEARQKHISNPKNGEDKPLNWGVKINNPSNVTYDSLSNGYYITDYGDIGYYPRLLSDDVDSSWWDGGIYYVSNEDHSIYKLPMLLDNPSGLEIVGDTLYVSDRYRIFLINLNNDSTMSRYYFDVNHWGLTDMVKDTSGNLFISSFVADSIYKFNIATRQITAVQTTGEPFDSIGSMVYEPRDNAIYFGTFQYKSKIMKLKLDSMVVSLAKQTEIQYLSGMDTDGDGNLFVAQNPFWIDSDHSSIIKFNRNFIGDSSVIIGKYQNYGINNIYYNKQENRIALTSQTGHYVNFVGFEIMKDTVKLVYPRDSAVNVETSVEFRFNKLKESDEVIAYRFMYAKNQGLSQNYKEIYLSGLESSIIVSNLDTSCTYYWAVKGYNGSIYSQRSEVRRFTTRGEISSPTAIYPEDEQTGVYSNVNFSWTAPANAHKFIFQSYLDKIGSKKFFETYADTNALLVDNCDSKTTYYWQVKAIGDSGASDWSPVYKFTTDTATLDNTYPITPDNGLDSCETQLDFTWEPVPDATHYIFKLCNTFNDVLVKNYLDTNAVTVTNFDTLTMYFWYIKSFNSQGTSSWNLSPYQFRTGNNLPPPPMINPVSVDGKPVDVNPLFTWQDMGATTYKIQIAEIKKDPITGIESADFLHPVFGTDNVPSNNFKLSSNLANDKQYAWKVKSIYTKKRRSNWSEINQFTTKSLVDVDESDYGNPIPLNPSIFSNEIFIRLPENFGFIQKYEVYDMHGELILSGHDFDNEREIRLNTYMLNDGLYLIRIKTNKGNYEIKGLKVR